MIKKIFISVLLVIILAITVRVIYTAIQQNAEFDYHANIPKTIILTSPDFIQNGSIPVELSGDYEKLELSPELHWSNLPSGTKSLVLLCTDYDGPSPALKLMTIDHWVVYNIPISKTSLRKGLTSASLKEEGISSGKNYKGTLAYKGPKPPIGKHRYFFRVYALSSTLKLTEPTKKEVMAAMKNNVLAYGELIGVY